MELSGLELPCPTVSDCQALSLMTESLDTAALIGSSSCIWALQRSTSGTTDRAGRSDPDPQSGLTALSSPACLSERWCGSEMAMRTGGPHFAQRTLRSCQPDKNWW